MDRGKIPVDLIMAKLEADARAAKHRLERARDIFHSPLATDIGATPYELVYQADRVRLKYYRPDTARLKTPLLLVHGLFNRETLLDLQPDRSIVHNLLKEGVEVYLIEWGSRPTEISFSPWMTISTAIWVTWWNLSAAGMGFPR